MNNNGMQRANLDYLEQLYASFQADPNSVESQWRSFFEGMEFAQGSQIGGMSNKELGVYQLIQAYRTEGHLEAQTNPLYSPVPHDSLSLKRFGLSEADLTSRFKVSSLLGKADATLEEILNFLKKAYCGTLSLQAGDASREEQSFLLQELEAAPAPFSPEEKRGILGTVTKVETLEKFIHIRYVGTKRFSIEGGDALIPMMERLTSHGLTEGVSEVFVGMAHRGRVNMLVNFMGKPESLVFGDFNGSLELESPVEGFDGDVKYHLGYHTEKKSNFGSCKVTLAYNPSHLEAVNAVALGMTYAQQKLRHHEAARQEVVPVLIHGEAAFAGQGIVQETLQMANTKGYGVGGTIHIIIDNQVGFTTGPEKTRSTRYASDVAKMTFTPVLHVNGDDVENCVRAMDIALRYRQKFAKDVLINMICFRKYGHNEGDEPAFTQGPMYDLIRKHPTLRDIYARQLVAESAIDQKGVDDLQTQAMDRLQKIYEETKAHAPHLKNFSFAGNWAGLRLAKPEDFNKPTDTRFDKKTLQQLGEKIGSYPKGFNPHPKLIKLLDARKAMAAGQEAIDWGMGEMLAFASLLSEGTSVRMTGEDTVRGTFVHRHAGLYDAKTGEAFFSLSDVNPKADFFIEESILSEYGVVGFEYGYSIQDPKSLVIWEAQFGDFVNGAQIILDQYLAAAEAKWQQMSGLVLLLPHGYEGQGPEHSSARLERFLQSSAQNNMQICNLTTPAQIYHALRRQMHRDFRKPLIVMSPKSLLRHPRAVSSLDDLAEGHFQEVIADTVSPSAVDTVVFVSGKLYYELLEEREKSKKDNIALVRLEQLYPFPAAQVTEILKSYPKAKTLIWAQEEPKNMGAFQNVYFRFIEVVSQAGLKLGFEYVGRPERSSPATGSVFRHRVEQDKIIKSIFGELKAP